MSVYRTIGPLVFSWQSCGNILFIKTLPKAMLKSWQVIVKPPSPIWTESQHLLFHSIVGIVLKSEHGSYVTTLPGPCGPGFQRTSALRFEHACILYSFKLSSINRATSHTKLLLSFEPRCEKTGLRVSDQVSHKPGCTATEDG